MAISWTGQFKASLLKASAQYLPALERRESNKPAPRFRPWHLVLASGTYLRGRPLKILSSPLT